MITKLLSKLEISKLDIKMLQYTLYKDDISTSIIILCLRYKQNNT